MANETAEAAAKNHAKHHFPYGPEAPGLAHFEGHVICRWIIFWIHHARKHGWNGTVTSGYRSPADQCRVCEQVCGNCNGCPGRCAAPGSSHHQGTDYPDGAVDVTDYGNFAQIMHNIGSPLHNSLPTSDPVHFSYYGN